LPATQAAEASVVEFTGRIQNISDGGISLLSESALEPTTFVRCSILSPDIPVPIPTLMQVRWSVVRKDHESQSYLSGLLFVA
jgi:hypothetical protein